MDRGPSPPADPRWKRLGWFVILWLGGVATLGAVALLIRSAIGMG